MRLKIRGVYRIVHRESGVGYVGQSFDVERRFRHHRAAALRGGDYVLGRALRKYGVDAFDYEVIEPCDSEEEALVAERYWIEWYGTVAPNGYNLTTGGESGKVHTAESCARMTASRMGRGKGVPLKPEHREKIRQATLGRTTTPETRKKMREARSRRAPPSDETRARLSAAMHARWAARREAAK